MDKTSPFDHNTIITQPYNDKGDILIDFSSVGCSQSFPSPLTSMKTFVVTTDNMSLIQQALDDTSYNKIVFGPIVYVLNTPLYIRRSNIVVEGSEGTRLVFKNINVEDPVGIHIKGDKWCTRRFPQVDVYDNYVPSGTCTLKLCKTNRFVIGDTVRIVRKGNKDWISHIGMDRIPSRPDGLNVTQWDEMTHEYDRTITQVQQESDCTSIVVNAPIPCAIDIQWGGGFVYKYINSRITHICVSNIVIESDHNMCIGLMVDNASNVLINNIKTVNCDRLHTIGRGCLNTTVENCFYDKPTSPIVGGNRHAYHIQGQLTLVRNCHAVSPRHAFSIDARVCGPNVIYKSSSENDHAASEPHHRWSVGTLFDNVKSTIYIQNRSWMGSGHGWSGANYVTWNCEGEVCCQNPPTADNFVIGHVGKKFLGAFLDNPQGHFISFGSKVEPVSLYEYQKNKA